ncbi:2-C-methyl-D-erythritol 4-phosphate cytidylyltransferase [Aeromonas hydrophila]|nr:2-C-methyl-D-erythritol 4-phosphate cytidylyltransferase [Aeromonas hydrophila]
MTAIVPAAGIGSRMGAECPKQYLQLAGRTILEHTLTRLLSHPAIAQVIVALAPHDRWFDTLAVAADPRILRVEGGAERAFSVLNALRVAAGEWVLVHDAARPCLTHCDLDVLIATAMACDGAILGSRVRDTMKRSDGTGNILATVDREQLWHALTPRCFPPVLCCGHWKRGWRWGPPSPTRPPPWSVPVSRCGWWKDEPTISR